MQVNNPLPIQSDHQKNYCGHPLPQSAEGLGHCDHSTHLLLRKILNTPWQLISFKIISSMRIINNLPLCRRKNRSARTNATAEGAGNE